jgi:hypothetical protein
MSAARVIGYRRAGVTGGTLGWAGLMPPFSQSVWLHGAVRLAAAFAALLGLVVAACGGGGGQPSPTPLPASPTTTATAPASPTPTSAPDTESVVLVAVGLGAYLETAVPVAVVRNAATAHSATGVRVHFAVVTPAGMTVQQTDADVGTLAPQQTSAIAGRIDLRASGDHAVATLSVAGFSDPKPQAVSAGPAACSGCPGNGPGFGSVHADLAAANGTPLPPFVSATAVCYDAGGAVVGGGTTVVAPRANGVDAPVILSNRAVRCDMYAATAGL